MKIKRESGILMPVASLPGKYGIGTFGKESYRFVDMLSEAGQSYWQILPLGPTSYGDSPYQSFSTFAGNPYFIDPEMLIEEGLLKQKEADSYDFGKNAENIDYGKIYESRFKMLKKAFARFDAKKNKAYISFCRANAFWLEDYALYMAVKNSFGGVSFIEWDETIRKRDKKTLDIYKKKYEDEIEFYKFLKFQSMSHLTVPTHGPIRNSSSLMRKDTPLRWRDVRPTVFRQRDSCGEILYITGTTMQRPDINGGYRG